MIALDTTAVVTADGKLTLPVPPHVSPGEHRVVVIIDERPLAKEERPPWNFPVDHYGSWPSNLSLRREDMYGDNGR